MNTPQILGPDGRPVTSQRVRMEKATRFNPLVNWTPDVLTRQLAAFARGEIRELAWVMEWLEKHDDTICAVAPKAKAAVARQGYDVEIRREVPRDMMQLAQDQRGVLQAFYDSIETGHAVDRDEVGGMRLLVSQVMDAYGKSYGAHHVIWNPTRAGLRATLLHVPLWFWEATEGYLRYLPSSSAVRGVDKETLGGPTAWMISRGRGVMLACAVASMFKRIPLQDWLTYTDRHAMPAFLGRTTAVQGTQQWTAMYQAVTSIGSEYAAVVNTGDSIEVLDLATQGELPYEKLIDRMDRACVMLWRGGDLSTISRSDGVGSNSQQEESDDLDGDNSEWASETIDRSLSPIVLRYHFGDVPQLAELRLRKKTRQNVREDLEVLKTFKDMGERVSRSWAVSKFGVVLADEDEPVLGEPVVPNNLPAPDAEAANESLQSTIADALGIPTEMLDPIRSDISAIEDLEALSDAEWLRFLERAVDTLPEFFADQDSTQLAKAIEKGLAARIVQGVREATQEP